MDEVLVEDDADLIQTCLIRVRKVEVIYIGKMRNEEGRKMS
jgi:hypothetical protein